MRADDRFGDHGLVGVALVELGADGWRIDTLLLSCRVIGRGIERSLVHVLGRDAVAAGAGTLLGEFVPTAKNAPAAGLYGEVGFVAAGVAADVQRWTFDLSAGATDAPAWIEIVEEQRER